MWYWLIRYSLLGPLWLLGRPKIEGLQHVPKDGPVIIAANHLAAIDSLYLAVVLRRRVTFLAKREYFTGTGLRGRFNRWFYTSCGQVPVDRCGGTAAQDALRAATRILESGGIWAIYPEGTRSPDGRIYRGRTGTLRVAVKTGAPVIPVALSGTDTVDPRGRAWRFGKVHIIFGAPRHYSHTDEQHAVRVATNELMRDLAALANRHYVDEYAATFTTTAVTQRGLLRN
ncbi:lysophospholipid acyltransferase family protein [Nocardia pseudovaccinii]|uniref:lysophospholipid acyltransferase family protein n=1 Tax=Nocardia pseudovaccinii TaxID=189540 RepID=UPI0009FCE9E2|nr:lysophospholipid acyltransferase family protein [Nocardia pseudovaccinii]